MNYINKSSGSLVNEILNLIFKRHWIVPWVSSIKFSLMQQATLFPTYHDHINNSNTLNSLVEISAYNLIIKEISMCIYIRPVK